MKNLSNENVIHICNNSIEYIQFKRLLKYPEIKHCYTMSTNGLDFKNYDTDDILQESYIKICDTLKLDKNSIITPHQTHTDKIEIVNNIEQKFDEVDGMITDKKNIILCTISADCTSLLFYDPEKNVICNVHSGWRGTLQKIGQKAVIKMINEYSCNPENIIACICPHIRKCHFEVEEDVAKMFQNEFNYTNKISDIIEKGRRVGEIQKYNIDTTFINKYILKEVGIKGENIIDSNICTVCERSHFHSYRMNREQAGRNAAIIGMSMN